MSVSSIVGVWTPNSEIEYDSGACGKGCGHTLCMGVGADHLEDGRYMVPWECMHGSWLMPASPPSETLCVGPLYSNGPEGMLKAREAGDVLSWADEVYLDDWLYDLSLTPDQRALRDLAKVLNDRADAEAIIKSKVHLKEEKWADRSGSMKFRVPRPCKYATLFAKRICANCNTTLPKGVNTCSAKVVKEEGQERRHDGRIVGTGVMVTRLAKEGDRGVRECGETLAGCWNHDQHGTCIYVHPDEPQWNAACAGTLRVKQDNRLVFCMAGEERSAASVAAAASASRFSALVGGGGGGGYGGGAQQHQPRGGALRPRIPSQQQAEVRDYAPVSGMRSASGWQQKPQGGRW